MRLTTIAMVAVVLLLAVAWALAPATRVDLGGGPLPAQVAATQAPADTPLSDILVGRYQPGFFPHLDGVVPAQPRANRVTWVRLKTDLPAGSGRWYVRVERANVDRMAVVLPDRPQVELAESRYFRLGSWDARWPDGFVLPLPAGLSGPQAVYLRVEGNVDVDLRPQVIDGASLEERAAAAARLFALVYGLLGLALLLCFVPAFRRHGAGGWAMAGLVLLTAGVIALVNDQLPLPLRAVLDPWLGGNLVYAATIVLAGTLLAVVRTQAGLPANSVTLDTWFLRIGLALVLLGALAVRLPLDYADLLRRVAELVWSQAWILVLVAFALDRRRMGSVAVVILLVLLGALVARALAAGGEVPPSALALYAYQVLIALLMVSMLALPWLRNLPVPAPRATPEAPVLSPEERWSRAQARLVASIQTALRHGGATDADWVVARRLVDTALNLLDARSAALATSGIHGDRIVAAPADSESAYAMLLRDRARVLRSLLRLGTPQQLIVPMGIAGPSQVALVPFRGGESGWTALLVERHGEAFDPAELLRLEALVAAAREVASHALEEYEAATKAELDPGLEVLNAEALQRAFRAAFERCRDDARPIALLRMPLGGEGGFEERARHLIEAVSAIDAPAHLLGRPGADELWLVLPGSDVPAARGVADALLARLAPAALPDSGLLPAGQRPRVAEWLVGIGGAMPGELVPKPMIERAGEALLRARVPGATAVQAVVHTRH